jgi:hypothetical protein
MQPGNYGEERNSRKLTPNSAPTTDSKHLMDEFSTGAVLAIFYQMSGRFWIEECSKL